MPFLPKYNILPVGLFTIGRGVWLSITNLRTTLWWYPARYSRSIRSIFAVRWVLPMTSIGSDGAICPIAVSIPAIPLIRRNVSFPVSRSRNTVCCRKNCTVIPVFSFRTSRFVVIPTMREPMCWEIYVRYLRKNWKTIAIICRAITPEISVWRNRMRHICVGRKVKRCFCGMLMGVSRDVMKTERSIAKPFPEKILRWRSIWSCNSMANNWCRIKSGLSWR